MDKETSTLMMMQTLTPTHVGSGTELSYVDLPLQRETHTGFPKIEASTLKGSIRNAVSSSEGLNKKGTVYAGVNMLLGDPDKGDYASAVSITDARLLFFPVKSALGIFAWITCPYAMKRFLKDYEIVSKCVLKNGIHVGYGGTDQKWEPEKLEPEEGSVYYADRKNLEIAKRKGNFYEVKKDTAELQIMLEDYTYRAEENKTFGKLLEMISSHLKDMGMDWKQFISHTVLVQDNDFVHFVKHSTEVATRIKIDSDTGTTQSNALFTEEYLPPETIMYSLFFFGKSNQPQKRANTDGEFNKQLTPKEVREEFINQFNQDIFQVGGDSSLGKGFVKKCFWKEAE